MLGAARGAIQPAVSSFTRARPSIVGKQHVCMVQRTGSETCWLEASVVNLEELREERGGWKQLQEHSWAVSSHGKQQAHSWRERQQEDRDVHTSVSGAICSGTHLEEQPRQKGISMVRGMPVAGPLHQETWASLHCGSKGPGCKDKARGDGGRLRKSAVQLTGSSGKLKCISSICCHCKARFCIVYTHSTFVFPLQTRNRHSSELTAGGKHRKIVTLHSNLS